ncbi:MAG TPA: hypothetical protein VGR37_22105 [Longimicrobiaceae bacterium]|nr:hypothetical protein [Longimicrobiaceae bacterium]
MSNPRIARLIEARSLEEMEASDAEIEGLWRNAVRELRDSGARGLSEHGAFTHAYQSAFHACTAVLRASGYRIRGAVGGHHYTTFYAVSALGIADVSALADEMQGLRLGRHDALYDWAGEVEEGSLRRLREVSAGLLDAGSRWLAGQRPGARLVTP